MARFLHRLGGAAVRHRKLVLLAWLVARRRPVRGLPDGRAGSSATSSGSPASSPRRRSTCWTSEFPETGGRHGPGRVPRRGRHVRRRRNAAALADTIAALGRPARTSARSPTRSVTGAVSADAPSPWRYVQYDVQAHDLPDGGLERPRGTPSTAARDRRRRRSSSAASCARYAERPETGAAEMIGIVAAVVILLLAFGSVIAGGHAHRPRRCSASATGFSRVTIVAGVHGHRRRSRRSSPR